MNCKCNSPSYRLVSQKLWENNVSRKLKETACFIICMGKLKAWNGCFSLFFQICPEDHTDKKNSCGLGYAKVVVGHCRCWARNVEITVGVLGNAEINLALVNQWQWMTFRSSLQRVTE